MVFGATITFDFYKILIYILPYNSYMSSYTRIYARVYIVGLRHIVSYNVAKNEWTKSQYL